MWWTRKLRVWCWTHHGKESFIGVGCHKRSRFEAICMWLQVPSEDQNKATHYGHCFRIGVGFWKWTWLHRIVFRTYPIFNFIIYIRCCAFPWHNWRCTFPWQCFILFLFYIINWCVIIIRGEWDRNYSFVFVVLWLFLKWWKFWELSDLRDSVYEYYMLTSHFDTHINWIQTPKCCFPWIIMTRSLWCVYKCQLYTIILCHNHVFHHVCLLMCIVWQHIPSSFSH